MAFPKLLWECQGLGSTRPKWQVTGCSATWRSVLLGACGIRFLPLRPRRKGSSQAGPEMTAGQEEESRNLQWDQGERSRRSSAELSKKLRSTRFLGRPSKMGSSLCLFSPSPEWGITSSGPPVSLVLPGPGSAVVAAVGGCSRWLPWSAAPASPPPRPAGWACCAGA